MILVCFAIILFFVVWGSKNYKQAFITYAAVSLLINSGMAIRYAPPSVSVGLVLNIYFVLLYHFKYRHRYKCAMFFPLRKSYWLMCIALLISAFVTWMKGSISGFTGAANNIFGIYLFIYVFWNVCDSTEDIKYFIGCLLTVFIVSYLYGIYEYTIKSNPILDYIKKGIPAEYAEGKLAMSDTENLRDGRFRAQSLFYISILYGIYSLLFMFFCLFVARYKKQFGLKKVVLALIVCFSLFACYTSNSKTPLVSIPLFLLPIVMKNRLLFFVCIVLSLIFLLSPTLLLSPLGEIINFDAFDAKNNDMSGGSNLYMRTLQLEASIEYWMQSPIFGNGLKSGAMFSAKDPRLFGCESVWFRTMIERGLLGLASYVVLIVNCLKVALKFDKSFYVFMYSIAFYVICSITDINYTLYFMCFMIMLKLSSNKYCKSSQ